MKKACIFLANDFEEVEGLTVADLLRRAGIEVLLVSITGEKKVTGSHHITVMADVLFEKAEYHDVDLLVLPGGMPGTLHLQEHEGLDQLLREFFAEGKKLAAICAAPTVFGAKGFLKGRKATCFSGMEGKLTGAIVTNAPVVVDGNITTSKGLGTAIDFSLSIIEGLLGKAAAKKLAEQIQYQYYLG
jgi:4-methyl-5(b-hydroxyethyl)-thiazole monophosphate biosynthesis